MKEVQVIRFNKEVHEGSTIINYSELSAYKVTPDQVWLNKYDTTNQKEVTDICNAFGVHRLVVADILADARRNSVEDYNEHLYFAINSIFENKKTALLTERMSFVLGENYLLSFQEKKGDHLDPVRKRIADPESVVRQKGVDYLLYLILRTIIEGFEDKFDEISDQEIAISEELTQAEDDSILVSIEKLKVFVFFIRKNINSFRDSMESIEIEQPEQIKEENIKYFVTLKQKCIQLLEELEMSRQNLESMSNIHYAKQSHRMNQIMKTLTILSAFFIPLTFLAGIYGMNFQHMPELAYKWAYPILLLMMVFTSILIYVYLRSKKWF